MYIRFAGFYERVVALKRRGVKVSIGLGGWNDSAGDKYSRLVNSRSSRKKFINNVLNFMYKYGFEGLDVDWEYPKCWQVDRSNYCNLENSCMLSVSIINVNEQRNTDQL